MRFTGSARPDTSHAQSRYFIWDTDHKWCDCFGLVHRGKMVHAVDCLSTQYHLSRDRRRSAMENRGLSSDPRDDEEETGIFGSREMDALEIAFESNWGDL